jgi:N-acetylglucosaminyl-diphospho-decaprenol L-rhamnosyltransferase
MMRASVVIVSYNSAHRLRDCLIGLREVFDFADDELIVVDNDSHDDSVIIVESICPEGQVIRNTENVGFARAVNQALRVASGDYVALVNPDVCEITGSLERVRQLLAEHSVAAVAVMLVDEDGALHRSCGTTSTPMTLIAENFALDSRAPGRSVLRKHLMSAWDMTDERDVDQACGALLFLSRRAIERVGPFDEQFFLYEEEEDWLRRAKQAGLRTVYTPEVRAVHAVSRSSAESDATLYLLLAESNLRYVRKWNGSLAAIGMRAMMILVDGVRVVAGLFPSERARLRARRAFLRLGVDTGRRAPRPERG